MEKSICIKKIYAYLLGLFLILITGFFIIKSFNTRNTIQSQASSRTDCQQKYGQDAFYVIGMGIASFQGYIRGDRVGNGYCYYRNPNDQCAIKYGVGNAFCSWSGGGVAFPGFTKKESCGSGGNYYCWVKNIYICKQRYGETAVFTYGTGISAPPGYLIGEPIGAGFFKGYCYYKNPADECIQKYGETAYCAYGGMGVRYPGTTRMEPCGTRTNYYCFVRN